MKFLRRVASAIVLAAAYATVFRIRGSGGTPPQHGGWRPLTLPALDADLDGAAIGVDRLIGARAETGTAAPLQPVVADTATVAVDPARV